MIDDRTGSDRWVMTADVDDRTRALRSAEAARPGSRCDGQQPGLAAVIEMAGGVGAPARARRWVRSCLPNEPTRTPEGDVALIVSELVTNSVVHAHVDSSHSLRITVAPLKDGLRIAVTDGGSETVPHLREADDDAPGGAGLRIIDRLCLRWGVTRNGGGTTEVWCDLPSASELT
jgi:anti-sigma regulatory factor (Ser/Thr protein kinase)